MADKRITELGERTVFDDTCEVPLDDGTQTFKIPGSKMFAFMNHRQFTGQTRNVGLAASAGSSALTIALKQANGTDDPASDTSFSPVDIWFRSTTLTSGARTKISFTAALSIVIPSTATMGYQNGADARVYVYTYYDGTNKGLMVSSRMVDTRFLYSLSEIGTGSDDNGLYADASRTDAALVLIGSVQVNAITTAGTWTSPTSVTVGERMQDANLYRSEVFTSSGTYYKKPNCKFIRVRGVGAGGGSGGNASTSTNEGAAAGAGGAGGYFEKIIANSSLNASETVTIGTAGTAGSAGNNSGGTGGTTSFGAHCSATGGAGGGGSSSSGTTTTGNGGNGGVGSGGDINITGGDGANGRVVGGSAIPCAKGGESAFGGGVTSTSTAAAGSNYGGGASGPTSPSSTSSRAGAAGAPGLIIVEEFY